MSMLISRAGKKKKYRFQTLKHDRPWLCIMANYGEGHCYSPHPTAEQTADASLTANWIDSPIKTPRSAFQHRA